MIMSKAQKYEQIIKVKEKTATDYTTQFEYMHNICILKNW